MLVLFYVYSTDIPLFTFFPRLLCSRPQLLQEFLLNHGLIFFSPRTTNRLKVGPVPSSSSWGQIPLSYIQVLEGNALWFAFLSDAITCDELQKYLKHPSSNSFTGNKPGKHKREMGKLTKTLTIPSSPGEPGTSFNYICLSFDLLLLFVDKLFVCLFSEVDII